MKKILAISVTFALIAASVGFAQDAETEAGAAPAPATAAAPASAKAVELGGGTFSLGLYFNSGFDIGWGSEAKRGEAYKDSGQIGSGHGDGISAVAHDADVDGYRANFNIGYDHKDWGLKLRIRSQANTAWQDVPRTFGISGEAFEWAFLHYGYAWYKPSDKVKVSGGIVDDGSWSTGGPIDDDAVGQDRGALFNFYPLDGLNAGFGVFDNGLGAVVVLGAGYEKKDVFSVRASTRFGRSWLAGDTPKTGKNPNGGYKNGELKDPNSTWDANNNPYVSTVPGYNTLFAGGPSLTDVFSKAFIGFNFTGVENLSLSVDSKIWIEGSDHDDDGATPVKSRAYNYAGATAAKLKIGLDGSYEAGDLTVGAQLWYYGNNFTEGEKLDGKKRYNHVNSTYDGDKNGGYLNDAGDFGFQEHLIDLSISPYASYKLQGGKIEPGFGFTVGFGGGGEMQQYGFEGANYAKSKVSELLLKVNPKVTFNAGKNAKFEAGYEYAFASQTVEKGTDGYKAYEQVGQKSTISLDFLISY